MNYWYWAAAGVVIVFVLTIVVIFCVLHAHDMNPGDDYPD